MEVAVSKQNMKGYKINRRNFIKASVAGAAVGALGVLPGRVGQAAEAEKAQIKIAGYDYDRVRAIMDGQVGIEGADVSFHYEDIYAVNSFAFGPKRKYEVTELGLIPFITKYINEDFRAYALYPRAGSCKASPEIRGAIPSLDIGTERRHGLMGVKLTPLA